MQMRVNGEISETFKLETGVRQCDRLSPILLNKALDEALQKLGKQPWEYR